MFEHVLAITCAILHATKVTNHLVMQTVDANFQNSGFSRFTNRGIDLFTRLLHHFLDARGMNAPVENQFFECDSSDLSTHRIKAR